MDDRHTEMCGLCECGCGQPAPIAQRTDGRWGWVKGQPVRFIHNHHARRAPVGAGPNPSGLCMCGCGRATGITRRSNTERGDVRGQHVRFCVGHRIPVNPEYRQLANGRRVHRDVYERAHGPIPDGCCVHHIDGNKLNNSLGNLVALSAGGHARLHAARRKADRDLRSWTR